MLVTIEDAGADTQVNIWDLTEVSSSAPSTTPLGTVTLSGDATPTSVAACMGYIIVGSEDGISIIDPHSGSWAERTAGWPRSLSTSTTPALTDNDVVEVAAGFSDQPTYDPRTGGDMPCFILQYGTGADIAALLKDDGSFYNKAGTVGNKGVGIMSGMPIWTDNDAGNRIRNGPPISAITADDWSDLERIMATNDRPSGYAADNGISVGNSSTCSLTVASNSGLFLSYGLVGSVHGTGNEQPGVKITRSINSGIQPPDARGCWLGNSKTVDHGSLANTLTENGTVTEAAVESGAELNGYSGWSASNYLSSASDTDWNSIGTGSGYLSVWMKSSGNTGHSWLHGFGNTGGTLQFAIHLTAGGLAYFSDDGATQNVGDSGGPVLDDGVWHKIDCVRISSAERYVYVDGVLHVSGTTDAGSVSGTVPWRIGYGPTGTYAADAITLSLARFSGTAPSAAQIRQWYDVEKPMFAANAECLLQSSSTDAVLDVDVDPLTGKVLVTQTDAITIFDGLAVDSKPTVNSGSSEKGKLWGDLRAEQNSANAYVTAPAVDQRQVNEMVRGLASELPAGVDLSKAKAWLKMNGTGTISISASYNIKSITDNGTGNYEVVFSTPFKSNNYVMVGSTIELGIVTVNAESTSLPGQVRIKTFTASSGAALDAEPIMVAFFGELENE